MRACGLRRSRYVGLAKTHLQHVATAAALNVVRCYAWVRGKSRDHTDFAPYTPHGGLNRPATEFANGIQSFDEMVHGNDCKDSTDRKNLIRSASCRGTYCGTTPYGASTPVFQAWKNTTVTSAKVGSSTAHDQAM